MKVDPLGLNAAQWRTIHELDGNGWSLSYLRNVVGGDPEFHAYRKGENCHLSIDEEGTITWLERSTTTTSGSSASSTGASSSPA